MTRPDRQPRFRISLRTRLTLLYTMLFVVTCVSLLALTYTLVRRQLTPQRSEPFGGLPAPDMTMAPEPSPEEVIVQANREALRTLLTQSGIGFVAMTVLAAVLCWLVAGRALHPVRRITAVASRLSQETLHARIALNGPHDEVKTLADSFDSMLDRLGRAFGAQQLFVANASHELRAPLTVIQTATELALSAPDRSKSDYRQALATIETAVHRVDRILDSLLTLAQTRIRQASPEPLDLSIVAGRIAGDLPPGGPDLRLHLTPTPVYADQVLIELMIRNLLENAVRYNVPHGWVSMGTRPEGEQGLLWVENPGPIVPVAQLPALAKPFRRGVQARTGSGPGSGLGLAIVHAVVETHRGRWELDARPTGGLRVTVVLPAEPDHHPAEPDHPE